MGLLIPDDLSTAVESRKRVSCYSKMFKYIFADGRAVAAAGLYDIRARLQNANADGLDEHLRGHPRRVDQSCVAYDASRHCATHRFQIFEF